MEKSQHKILLGIIIFTLASFIICGCIIDGLAKSWMGFLDLQLMPARLISDFIELRGIGAAFMNAALVALLALVIILATGVSLSGVTFATVFTVLGFGLFGKTPLNVLPIFLGVFLSSKIAKRSFKEYLVIALFGTALGPFVSFVAFEIGLSLTYSLLFAFGAGTIVGLLLPALAVSMLNMHQGYNLYNIGMTCGFLGIFLASLFKIRGIEYAKLSAWYSESHPLLMFILPALSVILIIAGLAIDKKLILKNWIKILKVPGQLPSDFFSISSLGSGFFNAGLMGLLGSGFVYFTGSHFNGPVLGGVLTIMGFGAFGTHPKNSIPVMTGVILCAFCFGQQLNSPGVILAIIFSTTLGPISGQFGFPVGLIAGFIHMVMVSQTGTWHGAMNLYNNGFAGGLTATFLVAILHWLSNNTNFLKKKVK
ncbi:MAG: DUF1576 domain-containing protein [Spirochaetes bacterium]|nr:DUF1576 domain-containing protein [Spirochaetota bacterium]